MRAVLAIAVFLLACACHRPYRWVSGDAEGPARVSYVTLWGVDPDYVGTG